MTSRIKTILVQNLKAARLMTFLMCLVIFGAGQSVFGTPAGHYDWGGDTGFYNMDFFYTVESDPGPSKYVFWAHQFWFEGGDGGYTGLQTNGLIRTHWVGKMAIFSIWQAVDANAARGATAQQFSGEGTGFSVRMPYQYEQGVRYRFRVASLGNTWWGITIENTSTGDQTYMGSIKVPATWGNLQGYSTNFTEVFAGAPTCLDQPYARTRFDLPLANDGTISANLTSWETYGACATTTDRAYPLGDALIHEIGVH